MAAAILPKTAVTMRDMLWVFRAVSRDPAGFRVAWAARTVILVRNSPTWDFLARNGVPERTPYLIRKNSSTNLHCYVTMSYQASCHTYFSDSDCKAQAPLRVIGSTSLLCLHSAWSSPRANALSGLHCVVRILHVTDAAWSLKFQKPKCLEKCMQFSKFWFD